MAYLPVVWVLFVVIVLSDQAICGRLISFKKEDFPDPIQNHTACGRAKESWVCDPGKYLTKQQGDDLNRILGTQQWISGVEGGAPLILIGVVPRIVTSNGNPVTASAGIRDFANYLRDTLWSLYSPNLIVITYHVARNEIWMTNGKFADITATCTCQITYESRKFVSVSKFHIALDIFTRKIVNIINGNSACSSATDVVPWMVNDLGECTWDKEITVNQVMPLTGLPDGGGLMVITGDNLGAGTSVLIGSSICNSNSSPSDRITCVIPRLPNTASLNTPVPVYLVIYGDIRYDTGWRYVYTKPSLTTLRPLTTIISGGLNLTVEGTNLNLVTIARMLLTLRGTATGKTKTYNTPCTIQSPLHMVCPTPKLDLDAVRNKRRKRDIAQAGLNMIKLRAIRATTMDGISIIVDNVEITVVILIDGENITLEEFRNELPMLRAYEDPVLQSFNGQDRTLTFVSVWPKSERSIDIKGSRLLPALHGHGLTVLIGRSRCEDVVIYANQLTCRPPVSKPPANGTHPAIQAIIGNLEFSIGYLEYIDNIWDYLPLRYGIIGGGAGLLLIIIIVIAICCCCCHKKA